MKTLKRALCLVLIVSLCMSLVTVASAYSFDDYTDAGEVTYTEAMDVLVALGIIEGSDGELSPTDTLTREQAAKMITYLILGKTAAEALSKTGGYFGDVEAGRWSAGYISYLASTGIIEGVGDTNGDGLAEFDPTASVTGYAFVKMLLGAIGYGANGEFNGSYWALNTASYGFDVGAFDDSKATSYDDPCTREEAMLYAFNILTGAMTVKYSELLDGYYSGSSPLTTIDEDDEYLYTLGYKVYELYKTDEDTDDFGRPYYQWEIDGDAISDPYYTDAELSYTTAVTSGAIYTALGKDYAGAADYYINGVQQDDFTIAKGYTSKAATIGGRGVQTFVYADEDSYDVTIVSIFSYLGEVTGVDDDEVTVSVYDPLDGSTYNTAGYTAMADYENVADSYDFETDGFADDDMVIVTVADGEVQSMESAASFTGVMGSNASSYMTISGSTYYKSAAFGYDEAIAADDYYSTYTFYTDAYGNVIGDELYEEADVSASNYVYVTASQWSSSLSSRSAAIAVTYLDGTEDVLYLDLVKSSSASTGYAYYLAGAKTNITSSSGAAITGLTNGFYRYTTDDDGYVTLKALSTSSQKAVAWLNDSVSVTSSNKYLNINSSTSLTGNDNGVNPGALYLNSSTVLYVIDDDGDVTTVTGYSNIKGYADESSAILVFYSGSIAQRIYVFGGSYTTSSTFGWYTGNTYNTSSGTFYRFYVEGETVDYELNGASTPSAYSLYDIEATSGELTGGTSVEMYYSNAQKVTSAKSSYFVAGGSYHYYDDDVEIYDGTNSGASATLSVGDYVVYAVEDGLVVAVYIVPAGSSTPTVVTDLEITGLALSASAVTFTDNDAGETVYLVVEKFATSSGYADFYSTSVLTTGTDTTVAHTFGSGDYRVTVYAEAAHSTILAQAYATIA